MRCKRARLSAALMVAAVTAAGCGSGASEQDPESSIPVSTAAQAPAPLAPLTADPARSAEDTMVLVAETVLTVYPQSEEPGDAWWRADEVLSPEGQFPHRAEKVEVPRGRGQWLDWQSRGIEMVEAQATVTNEDHPPDTDTIAARVLSVDLTEHAPRGGRRLVERQTYYVTVTRGGADEPWLVEALMQP